MMQEAKLSKQLQDVLWTKAVRCTNTVYNITYTEDDFKCPFERFVGHKPKITEHLVPFGRYGFVTVGQCNATWDLKATKMIMVGYRSNKSRDTY